MGKQEKGKGKEKGSKNTGKNWHHQGSLKVISHTYHYL